MFMIINKVSEIIKILTFLAVALMGLCFSGCSDDDKEGEEFGIIGNTYKSYEFYLDEDGWGWENTCTINFVSSSSCEIKAWGYDYMDYEKERYSWSKTCSYTLSGNIITLKKSPFYHNPKDDDFKNCGGYLERIDSGERFYKQ